VFTLAETTATLAALALAPWVWQHKWKQLNFYAYSITLKERKKNRTKHHSLSISRLRHSEACLKNKRSLLAAA
jgi:hypothetical protein